MPGTRSGIQDSGSKEEISVSLRDATSYIKARRVLKGRLTGNQ